MTSLIGGPEPSTLRTENIPSISDRDFAEISEKIEKSIGGRVQNTEAGQREILKMIENLYSKKDSLSGQASSAIDLDVNENHPESLIPTSKPIEVNELTRKEGQHMLSGVFTQTEIPPRSSSLPPPNQKYPDHIVDKMLESLRNATQQNIELPRLPKALSTTMPTFTGRNDKVERAFRRPLHDKPQSIP